MHQVGFKGPTSKRREVPEGGRGKGVEAMEREAKEKKRKRREWSRMEGEAKGEEEM